MSDEDTQERIIPVGDPASIFPHFAIPGTPVGMSSDGTIRHGINWNDPDSQRFLSALERIATALENKHGAPDVYMQDEYEVLMERDKVLQSLVSQAYHARDASQMHWLIMQMARQLGVFEEEKPTS